MKKALILFQFILAINLVGQQIETCGTVESTDEEMTQKPWYYDNNYLDVIENAKDQLLSNSLQRKVNFNPSLIINPISIPIRFWIYEDAANNTPIPNERQLQVTIDQLNLLFQSNSMNVRFYMHCNEIIDDADALVVRPFEAYNKFKRNRDILAINVHIVDDYTGAGAVYNTIGDFIVIEQDIYENSNNVSTLAHEIGHYFSLEHTHRNSNRGQCRQEAINRSTKFTFGQFFSCFGKTGRVCEKNGDALCDTLADPDFSINILGEKVNNGDCTYVPEEVEMDAWGDTYTNNNVDTRNIMSYSDSFCRDNFSRGQVNQMWQIIFFSGIRNFIFDLNIVDNFIDPDQYEPDDSDLVEVPRVIEVGETQFHSFHGFDECPDIVDWLRIDNSNGEIGSYVVEVNSVEGFINAVEQVNIYNTDTDGNRAAKFSEITGGNGSIQIPCNTSTNDFLIEVVKAEDPEDEIVQSIYTISLSATPGVAISNAEQTELCSGNQYEILNLPTNASVNWSSSFGTSIQVNNDQSIFILNGNIDATEYWIRAVVNANGCQKVLTKTFVSANSGSFQGFEIVEVVPACNPANSVLEYGIYRTVPATNVNWNINSGSIFGASNGTSISVNPTFGNFTLTATQVNECGQDFSVSKNFFADECDCPFGLRFSNISDETIEMEIISQSANFRAEPHIKLL